MLDDKHSTLLGRYIIDITRYIELDPHFFRYRLFQLNHERKRQSRHGIKSRRAKMARELLAE
jgi:hypothetical protein